MKNASQNSLQKPCRVPWYTLHNTCVSVLLNLLNGSKTRGTWMLIILDIQTSVSTVILPKNVVKNTEESTLKRVAENCFPAVYSSNFHVIWFILTQTF